MKDDRAFQALSDFYNRGYECLQPRRKLQGLFISDCGIIFTREGLSLNNQFEALLSSIENLNRLMLNHDLMLTTSISYGEFSYHNRIEFDGIQKNPIYGNAYLSAYLDNENGRPKIEPGMCRVTKKNLPNEIVDYINTSNNFKFEETKDHFLYYWMCNQESIDKFKDDYNNSYNMKYRGMLYSLKNAVGENNF